MDGLIDEDNGEKSEGEEGLEFLLTVFSTEPWRAMLTSTGTLSQGPHYASRGSTSLSFYHFR